MPRTAPVSPLRVDLSPTARSPQKESLLSQQVWLERQVFLETGFSPKTDRAPVQAAPVRTAPSTDGGLAALRSGLKLRKTGRDGKSKRTTLYLSTDGKKLIWSARKRSLSAKAVAERTVAIDDVTEVRTPAPLAIELVLTVESPRARAFQRARKLPGARRFSAVPDGAKLLLELTEADRERHPLVVAALRGLIEPADAEDGDSELPPLKLAISAAIAKVQQNSREPGEAGDNGSPLPPALYAFLQATSTPSDPTLARARALVREASGSGETSPAATRGGRFKMVQGQIVRGSSADPDAEAEADQEAADQLERRASGEHSPP